MHKTESASNTPPTTADGDEQRAKRGLGIALVLVDVINGFDFPDSASLVKNATAVAPNIEALAESARQHQIPIIYVNDNFGMWQSDFRAVCESCLKPERPGREVARRLLPRDSDYFVLKPRHSGFLGTPLEALLNHLQAHAIVLAGFATDLCVLFTAVDAHARGFWVTVVEDATAAKNEEVQRMSIALMNNALPTPAVKTNEFDWQDLARTEKRRMF